MISDKKITEQQINEKGVISAPDVLTGTASENKLVFDQLARTIASSYNGLIDELMDSGAESIGVDVEGLDATDVNAALTELAAEKVDKVAGKGLSTNDYTNEDKAEVAKVAGKADQSALTAHIGDTSVHLSPSDKTAIADVANKVDKVAGKGLSTNDYTNEDKEEVAKVAGKADQSALTAHTGDTSVHVSSSDKAAIADVANKVDKVAGKGLSTNDYTNEEKAKLQTLQPLPDGGTDGQVLAKNGTGLAWETRELPADAQAKVDTHAADTTLHPTAAQKAGWDGKLDPNNVLAGRNVTIDRAGSTITINSDGSGGGGDITNADTVDGYHVDDTKGGTNPTTDNALWTAMRVLQQISGMGKVVVLPEEDAPQLNNYDLWLICE